VVNDFRSADLAAGGHGAPLVPLYHRALAAKLPKPLAILNIGGVANLTYIGGDDDTDLLAFDTGPGNALIDDWVLKKSGHAYDEYGLQAAKGRIDTPLVDAFLAKPFFRKKPPKSLDRNSFISPIDDKTKLSDGAATLTMITARSIVESLRLLPQQPNQIYVTGGGRLNNTLMRWIADLAQVSVASVDDLGWSGDGLEAEAFAYLAVRSHLGLPLSVPGTTGVSSPMTGGRMFRP
jgi:anhydro-N-acetylmuramic acid kinase